MDSTGSQVEVCPGGYKRVREEMEGWLKGKVGHGATSKKKRGAVLLPLNYCRSLVDSIQDNIHGRSTDLTARKEYAILPLVVKHNGQL